MRYVWYTAALPAYRRSCLEVLAERLGDQDWRVFTGDDLSDRTVRTDLPPEMYVAVSNFHLFGNRLIFQWGHWPTVLGASTAILDLNPRSITAWIILAARRALGRRTLLWGHLHPRRGPSAPTARLRAMMRRLANGCVVYSHADGRRLAESAKTKVWVAPNALYRRADLVFAESSARTLVLYVGRLEPEKKVGLLLTGFAEIADERPEWTVGIVGSGSQAEDLMSLARRLSLEDRVVFHGALESPRELAALYAQAHCAVSPGPVGLALTQSLGFGVPMVLADHERHGPEIELADPACTVLFRAQSSSDLALALLSPALRLDDAARRTVVDRMQREYSAESMADGFLRALQDQPS